jgi:AraC family transcriptional regulator
MPEIITAHPLLKTAVVAVGDVYCQGRHAPLSHEERAAATYLVFPYRGVFVRHLGRDQAVAEPNQVLFFNRGEPYRVSHPVPGGDASLNLAIKDALLQELAPSALLRGGSTLAFRRQRLRIDARAQALVALLRHSLRHGLRSRWKRRASP